MTSTSKNRPTHGKLPSNVVCADQMQLTTFMRLNKRGVCVVSLGWPPTEWSQHQIQEFPQHALTQYMSRVLLVNIRISADQVAHDTIGLYTKQIKGDQRLSLCYFSLVVVSKILSDMLSIPADNVCNYFMPVAQQCTLEYSVILTSIVRA